MDPKTTQKVKFVYPKNKDSVELLKTFFDVENLPEEFGGKATLKYDHQEFSRWMLQDDIKTQKFWDTNQKMDDNRLELSPLPPVLAQRPRATQAS